MKSEQNMQSKFNPDVDAKRVRLEYCRWLAAKEDIKANGQTFDNMFGNLRFGQFFLNNFLKAGETWPEVYYETDTVVSLNKILEHFDDIEKHAV